MIDKGENESAIELKDIKVRNDRSGNSDINARKLKLVASREDFKNLQVV